VGFFDFSILNYIHDNFQCGFLDTLMPVVSELGNAGLIWIVIAGAFLIGRKNRMAGVAMLCALVLDLFVCNIVLKPLVARIRPFDVNTAVQLLIARPTDYSFPSGHTTAAFAATSALYFSRRRLWIPALALAALIAFSRLYLYVHYPTDILAGIVVGIGVGYLGWRAAETLSGSWKRRKNSK
jgi:undecaprenyl-diphosphatase